MSFFLNQAKHITQKLKLGGVECHHSNNLPTPDDAIVPLIERAGFADVVTIGSFKIYPSLVTAMTERWRPETHTFHLPVGECTITLQDVALQLGLRVDGDAVTGSTERNWDEVFPRLLGKPLPKDEGMVGNQIKFSWLKREFKTVPVGASEQQLNEYCRAYLLLVIGGVLLPDKSGNRVNIKYLPLLEDIDQIQKYSWGSACLTNLYRNLCTTATEGKSSSMGGCTLLLQSWVWYRMSFLAPSCDVPYDWPLAKRWADRKKNHTHCPKSLVHYREDIDRMTPDQFDWLPYDSLTHLPQRAYMDYRIWHTRTYIVCYHMVEWHPADRVLLQYGLVQEPPQEPEDMSSFHKITMQGQHDTNWERFHEDSIAQWNDRLNHCVTGERFHGTPAHSAKYMRWFQKNTNLFISDNQRLKDPRHHVDVGVVDEEDPAPRTQTERQQLNLARRQRAQKQKKPQTVHQTQDHVPHRHSISHQTPTFQQNTPYADNFHQTPTFQQHTPYADSFHQTPTFQQHTPYADSFHHTPTFQQNTPYAGNFHQTPPFQQHTPYADHFHQTPPFQQHRHSTTEMNVDAEDPWFGQQYDSAQNFSYLAFLQQQVTGGTSSAVPEFTTEQPVAGPSEEERRPQEEHRPEEQHRPPNRRSKRVPRPKGCGTGGHLHH